MKKILLALAVISSGFAAASLVLRAQTVTLVVEREVEGVPVIEISGVIDRGGARKIVKALRKAENTTTNLVVISIESPGGEVAGIMNAADMISDLSIPTVGFVREGVGGAIFLIAAVDQIYFSPEGVCGAASFVMPSLDPEITSLSQKTQSHFGSKIREYAKANGHDPDLFLAMTDPSNELIRGTKTWKSEGEIMTLTATEALAIGLSQGTRR